MLRPPLARVSEAVSEHLDEIAGHFKPGAKLTLLVRRPEHPDGSQDFMLTNDDLDDVLRAIEIRKGQGSWPHP